VTSDIAQHSMHLTLKRLIDEKSMRDRVKFTACQLAQALGMQRSIITKLTHNDITKRVTNPNMDTVIKIVEFFKADGFDITIEGLLGLATKAVDIKNHKAVPYRQAVTMPIYSISKKEKMGIIDIKMTESHKDTIALYADRDIKPFFKTGSIFVVDQNAVLKNGNLIAVKLDGSDNIDVKKYCILKNKIFFKSLDEREKDILLSDTQSEIIGVIVQVNAKT